MLTLLGLRKVKGLLIKLGVKNDPEVTAVIQTAVIGINRIIKARFPKP